MCKRIFKFELQLSSYWPNFNFSRYCPKFHIFTNIVIFQVYLQLFRPTASSLQILWQEHVRNTLFHFCQLWAVNTDLSLKTKIKTANFVGPKTCRSIDRVIHLDVIALLMAGKSRELGNLVPGIFSHLEGNLWVWNKEIHKKCWEMLQSRWEIL